MCQGSRVLLCSHVILITTSGCWYCYSIQSVEEKTEIQISDVNVPKVMISGEPQSWGVNPHLSDQRGLHLNRSTVWPCTKVAEDELESHTVLRLMPQQRACPGLRASSGMAELGGSSPALLSWWPTDILSPGAGRGHGCQGPFGRGDYSWVSS